MRTVPRKIALGAIGSHDHVCASIAVPIFAGFVRTRITDIEDPDGAHEIELRFADVDAGTILRKTKGDVIE